MVLHNTNYQSYLDERCSFSETLPLIRKGHGEAVNAPDGLSRCHISPLDWDTRVLGVSAASVGDIFFKSGADWDGLAGGVDIALKNANWQFASLRVDAAHLDLIAAFTRLGWKLVDILDVFEKDLRLASTREIGSRKNDDFTLEEGLVFFEANPGLFSDARMHRDVAIPFNLAHEFYREVFVSQLDNASAVRAGHRLSGTLAGLAVGCVDNELAFRLGLRLGYLWLVGVTGDCRGQGIGRKVLESFEREAVSHMDFMEVGTQVNNIAARRLYLSAGFRPVAAAVTLHRWL